MPTFLTGKTSVLSVTFAISGNFAGSIQGVHDPRDPDPRAYGTVAASCGWGCAANVTEYRGGPPDASTIGYYGIQVHCEAGPYSDDNVFYLEHDMTTGPLFYGWDYEGAITFTADVEEFFETFGKNDPVGDDPNVWDREVPDVWDREVPDAPEFNGIRFKQRLRQGGNITASISVSGSQGGTSANCGGTIPITEDRETQAVTQSITGIAGGNAGDGASATYSISPYSCSFPLSPAPAGASCSASSSDGRSSATASAFATVTLSAGSKSGISGSAVGSPGATTPYAISLVARALDVPYPETLGASVNGHEAGVAIIGGAGGATGTLNFYEFGGVAGDGAQETSYHFTQPDAAPRFSASLSTDSLIAAGEVGEPIDPDDENSAVLYLQKRIPFRGKSFPGISIVQAGSVNLLNGVGVSTLEGEKMTGRAFMPPRSCLSYRYLKLTYRTVGAANVDLLASIGAPDTTIDPAEYGDPDGDLIDTYTGATADGTDGGDVGEEEPSTKEWALKSGGDGAWETVYIDLCSPDSVSDIADGQDTRWPTPSRMPRYFGVWRLDGFVLTPKTPGSFPEDATLEISEMSLALKPGGGDVTFDFCPAFEQCRYHYPAGGGNPRMLREWQQKERPDLVDEDGTTHEFFTRRFLLGDCQGRQTLEEPDLSYKRNTPYGADTGDNVTWDFISETIASLAARVNMADKRSLPNPETSVIVRYPGVTATVLAPAVPDAYEPTGPGDYPPASDYYHNAGMNAVFLAGGGALATPLGWRFGFDVPEGGNVNAQPLYDIVETYHGAGDVFGLSHLGQMTGLGSSGDTLTLCGAVILRGAAHGLVLGSATPNEASKKTPLGGKSVQLRDALEVNRGTGSSEGVAGRFTTGTPAGRAFAAHTIGVLPDFAPSVSAMAPGFLGRKRRRAVFVVLRDRLEPGRWLSADISPTWRASLAYVGDDGVIRLRFLQSPDADVFDETVTGITGERPCIRYMVSDIWGRLLMTWEGAGGAILRARTRTEGESWDMAMTVFNEGAFPAMAISPTGVEHHFARTSAGAVETKLMDAQGNVMATGTAVAAGVVAEDALAAWFRYDGSVYLSYHAEDGGAIVVVRSRDGVTFA